jgi:hypothetical protein
MSGGIATLRTDLAVRFTANRIAASLPLESRNPCSDTLRLPLATCERPVAALLRMQDFKPLWHRSPARENRILAQPLVQSTRRRINAENTFPKIQFRATFDRASIQGGTADLQ